MKKSLKLFNTVGIVLSLSIALGLYTEGSVFAQEETSAVTEEVPPVKKKAEMEYEIETMTVTAQKREENVQDVPMSVDVFTGMQLEDAGIDNAFEMTWFSPNVFMKQNTSELIIRGVSTFHTSVFEPAGFYVDDVSYSIPFMRNIELLDIERIEVLKGPQGTLYGRNSESGVINIITKQPDNELRGKIFGEYNSYDTEHGSSPGYKAGGSISGPMVKDKLYLGLAGQWKDSDGFMKNEYNDNDEAGKIEHINGRATLRWTPADKWDISFIADVMDMDDGIGYYRFIDGQNKTDRHKIKWDGANYWDKESAGQSLRINYEGRGFDVLSITGRNDFEMRFANDLDFSSAPLWGNWGDGIFKYEDVILSQELRVSSPKAHGPFAWLAGVYGFTEDVDIKFDMPAWGEKRVLEIDIQGHAVFGQGTYTFFDRLHLTAGLRYDHLDLEGKQQYQFIDMMTWSSQTLNFNKDLDYDEVLPKFSAAFDFTDDIMSYATVSKGYLAGSYNYAFVTDQSSFTYDPEYTWNYEAGMKTAWLDNRLMANATVFYIDIKDKQVPEWLQGGGLMDRTVKNAAKAHSQGIELELQARPAQGLDLFGGVGYTEAKIDDWTSLEADGTTYDYKDKYPTYAPKYTYNAGVQYRHYAGLFGRADILGVGDFYSDAKNKVKIDSYELVNLRLGYESEHFDAVLWCKNVFDKEYAADKQVLGGATYVMDTAPRMFGATLTYRF
jgi:iron complex outermembrane receptor protein